MSIEQGAKKHSLEPKTILVVASTTTPSSPPPPLSRPSSTTSLQPATSEPRSETPILVTNIQAPVSGTQIPISKTEIPSIPVSGTELSLSPPVSGISEVQIPVCRISEGGLPNSGEGPAGAVPVGIPICTRISVSSPENNFATYSVKDFATTNLKATKYDSVGEKFSSHGFQSSQSETIGDFVINPSSTKTIDAPIRLSKQSSGGSTNIIPLDRGYNIDDEAYSPLTKMNIDFQRNSDVMMDFDEDLDKKAQNRHEYELDLSDDIWTLIFGFLTASELAVASTVCKRYQDLITQKQIWAGIGERVFPGENLNLDSMDSYKSIILNDFFRLFTKETEAVLPKTADCVFSHIVRSWYYRSKDTGRQTLVVESPLPDADGLGHATIRHLCHPYIHTNKMVKMYLCRRKKNALFIFKRTPILLSTLLRYNSNPQNFTQSWTTYITPIDNADDAANGNAQNEVGGNAGNGADRNDAVGNGGDAHNGRNGGNERQPNNLPHRIAAQNAANAGKRIEVTGQSNYGGSLSRTFGTAYYGLGNGTTKNAELLVSLMDRAVRNEGIASERPGDGALSREGSAGTSNLGPSLKRGRMDIINGTGRNRDDDELDPPMEEDEDDADSDVNMLASSSTSKKSAKSSKERRNRKNDHSNGNQNDSDSDVLPQHSKATLVREARLNAAGRVKETGIPGEVRSGEPRQPLEPRSGHDGALPTVRDVTHLRTALPTSGLSSQPSSDAQDVSNLNHEPSSLNDEELAKIVRKRIHPLERTTTADVVRGRGDGRVIRGGGGLRDNEELNDLSNPVAIEQPKPNKPNPQYIKLVIRDILLLLHRLHSTGSGHGNLDASKVILDVETGRPIELLDFFFGSGVNRKSYQKLAHDRESLGISYVKKPPESLLAAEEPPENSSTAFTNCNSLNQMHGVLANVRNNRVVNQNPANQLKICEDHKRDIRYGSRVTSAGRSTGDNPIEKLHSAMHYPHTHHSGGVPLEVDHLCGSMTRALSGPIRRAGKEWPGFYSYRFLICDGMETRPTAQHEDKLLDLAEQIKRVIIESANPETKFPSEGAHGIQLLQRSEIPEEARFVRPSRHNNPNPRYIGRYSTGRDRHGRNARNGGRCVDRNLPDSEEMIEKDPSATITFCRNLQLVLFYSRQYWHMMVQKKTESSATTSSGNSSNLRKKDSPSSATDSSKPQNHSKNVADLNKGVLKTKMKNSPAEKSSLGEDSKKARSESSKKALEKRISFDRGICSVLTSSSSYYLYENADALIESHICQMLKEEIHPAMLVEMRWWDSAQIDREPAYANDYNYNIHANKPHTRVHWDHLVWLVAPNEEMLERVMPSLKTMKDTIMAKADKQKDTMMNAEADKVGAGIKESSTGAGITDYFLDKICTVDIREETLQLNGSISDLEKAKRNFENQKELYDKMDVTSESGSKNVIIKAGTSNNGTVTKKRYNTRYNTDMVYRNSMDRYFLCEQKIGYTKRLLYAQKNAESKRDPDYESPTVHGCSTTVHGGKTPGFIINRMMHDDCLLLTDSPPIDFQNSFGSAVVDDAFGCEDIINSTKSCSKKSKRRKEEPKPIEKKFLELENEFCSGMQTPTKKGGSKKKCTNNSSNRESNDNSFGGKELIKMIKGPTTVFDALSPTNTADDEYNSTMYSVREDYLKKKNEPHYSCNPLFASDMWQLGLLVGTLAASRIGCSWVTQWLPPSLCNLVLDSEISWLYQLFGLLGTPTHWEPVRCREFPQWRPCRLFHNPTGKYETVSQKNFVESLGGQVGVDLLRGFLTIDPERRINVSEALAHPYFNDIRGEIDSILSIRRPFIHRGPALEDWSVQQSVPILASEAPANQALLATRQSSSSTSIQSPSLSSAVSSSSSSCASSSFSSVSSAQDSSSSAAQSSSSSTAILQTANVAGSSRVNDSITSGINNSSFWRPHDKLSRHLEWEQEVLKLENADFRELKKRRRCNYRFNYDDSSWDFHRMVHSIYVEDKKLFSEQTDINADMRSVLVDWLVEVHHKFKFDFQSTLFLSINILDRFLDFHDLESRKRLQLVGLACLLIASKIEETRPAIVEELGFICEHTYSDDEIRDMEFEIVEVLFNNGHFLRMPTVVTFLALDARWNVETKGYLQTIADYLLELTLLDMQFLKCPLADLAKAALDCAELVLLQRRRSDEIIRLEEWERMNGMLIEGGFDSPIIGDDCSPFAYGGGIPNGISGIPNGSSTSSSVAESSSSLSSVSVAESSASFLKNTADISSALLEGSSSSSSGIQSSTSNSSSSGMNVVSSSSSSTRPAFCTTSSSSSATSWSRQESKPASKIRTRVVMTQYLQEVFGDQVNGLSDEPSLTDMMRLLHECKETRTTLLPTGESIPPHAQHPSLNTSQFAQHAKGSRIRVLAPVINPPLDLENFLPNKTELVWQDDLLGSGNYGTDRVPDSDTKEGAVVTKSILGRKSLAPEEYLEMFCDPREKFIPAEIFCKFLTSAVRTRNKSCVETNVSRVDRAQCHRKMIRGEKHSQSCDRDQQRGDAEITNWMNGNTKRDNGNCEKWQGEPLESVKKSPLPPKIGGKRLDNDWDPGQERDADGRIRYLGRRQSSINRKNPALALNTTSEKLEPVGSSTGDPVNLPPNIPLIKELHDLAFATPRQFIPRNREGHATRPATNMQAVQRKYSYKRYLGIVPEFFESNMNAATSSDGCSGSGIRAGAPLYEHGWSTSSVADSMLASMEASKAKHKKNLAEQNTGTPNLTRPNLHPSPKLARSNHSPNVAGPNPRLSSNLHPVGSPRNPHPSPGSAPDRKAPRQVDPRRVSIDESGVGIASGTGARTASGSGTFSAAASQIPTGGTTNPVTNARPGFVSDRMSASLDVTDSARGLNTTATTATRTRVVNPRESFDETNASSKRTDASEAGGSQAGVESAKS